MSTGTLNGQVIERAAITLPRWGVWTADVQLASGAAQSGAATIEIAGLTLQGTILPDQGGVYAERGFYRVVGGAGGWRSTVGPKAYRNASGVKLSTVVRDAARDAGETLATFTDRVVGPAFVRPEGEAARPLDLLVPQGWHVGEDGVTRLSVRAAAAYQEPYQVMNRRPDRAAITIAAESLAGLVPGATLDGVEAASVRHELSPAGLRTHIAAHVDGLGDRLLGAFRRVVDAVTRRAFYLGQYEYRVTGTTGGYCDLAPVARSLGLPNVANVAMRSGVPGCFGAPAVGTVALVAFINGDPTRPFVCGFDGTVPTDVDFQSTGLVKAGGSDELVRNAPFAQWVASVESGVLAAGGSVTPSMATIIANPAYGPHATQKTRGA